MIPIRSQRDTRTSIFRATTLVLLSVLALAGCEKGQPESQASYGPHPVLPAPDKSLLPTANFSTAIPWPAAAKPVAPEGFGVTRYATALDHPRWIYVLPNGDVLVAESATVPKAPMWLSWRIANRCSRFQPPKLSATSARPSSCRHPVMRTR